MTWRDEMKTPENVDELATLIIGLTGYHAGHFCIEYSTFIKEFPFITNKEAITQLIEKLRVRSIFIRNVKKISTTSNLESNGSYILVVQKIEL